MAQGEKIIGIDLGTTNSVVGRNGRKRGQGNPQSGRKSNDPQRCGVHQTKGIPSWVSRPGRQAVTNPHRTVYSIKRFMGRRHSEVASERRWFPTGSWETPRTT